MSFVKLKSRINIVKSLFNKNLPTIATKFRACEEYPHAVINYKIPFDEYGMYLLAEDKIRTASKIIFLGPSCIICCIFMISYPLSIYGNLAMIWFSGFIFGKLFKKWESLLGTNLTKSDYLLPVDKIYLSNNLKEIIIYKRFTDTLEKVEIKSLSPIDEESYNNSNSPMALPVAYTKEGQNNFIYIPFNILIYDRELFSAIFRGYPIKVEEEEQNKDKYIFAPSEIILQVPEEIKVKDKKIDTAKDVQPKKYKK